VPVFSHRGGFSQLGIYRPSKAEFWLDDGRHFPCGVPGDQPIVGTFLDKNHLTYGVYRPLESTFYFC
jgi:hypothetical protein